MASPLLQAAAEGDIKFLKKFYEENDCKNNGDPSSYFLGCTSTKCRNLLHAAIEKERYTFLFETLDILSAHPKLVIDLICQKESEQGYNPIHSAAYQGNIFTLKLLVSAYAKADSVVENNQEIPPWLAKNSFTDTPLRCSLVNKITTQENIARYLLSLDQHLLRTVGQAKYPMDHCSTLILDKSRQSIVYLATAKGFSRLVEQILTSVHPYSVRGCYGDTPLHFASKCDEQVSRLLLKKHPELIGKVFCYGITILHRAVEEGATWLVRLMLTEEEDNKCNPPRVPWTKACRRLIWHRNIQGDTPLHISARKGNLEISKLLIQGYKSALQDEAEDCHGKDPLPKPENDFIGVNPLYIVNRGKLKDIPLVLALRKKRDDCGVMLFNETFPVLENQVASLYENSLQVAIENGCFLSAKMIFERVARYGAQPLLTRLTGLRIFSSGVLKIFSHIRLKYQDTQEMLKSEEFEKLLEESPRFLKDKQKNAKTVLKEAAETGKDWLVRLALKSDKSLLQESVPAWQVACEKGYLSTLLIFIELCTPQEFIELCKNKKQTPLHHIKLLEYDQYVELLTRPVIGELKNEIDSDGATPLHRAILRDDLELTKALLETTGIDVSIKDKNGTTALDLLEQCCKFSSSWLEQYIKLLKMPVFEMLLNQCETTDGTTPLHRAILRDDLELTKALLETKGIDVSIKDKNGTTALDLLQKSCGLSPTWGKMCREIKEDSTVKKLKYLFRKISFEGMQNTLSVVAALVATITFAAGFTVPGGPDSKNGTPVLATEAAFLVFSISNTLAMCCSIMVLFLLLGPMMWDPHPSLFYVNLSLLLLLSSLVGTMVAFMSGVYATMAPKAKWNAIFVIVSCSLALFMACIVLLLTYSPRFKKLLGKPFVSPKVLIEQKHAGDSSFFRCNREYFTSVSTDLEHPHVSSLISNTSVTQTSKRQTPKLNKEVRQSCGTSYQASSDINIEIKQLE